jgi:4-hydroxybenzoate polyprenyltransferase
MLIVFGATFAVAKMLYIETQDSVILALIVCMGLIAANIENDVVDRETDKLTEHKSDRPIPSGLIRPGEAISSSIILYVFCLVLSYTLSLRVLFVTGFYLVCVSTYNHYGKRSFGMFGHALAALSATSCVVLPMIHSLNWSLCMLAIGLFLLETGRELIVVCPDYLENTGRNRCSTVPSQLGIRNTLILSYAYTVPAIIICMLNLGLNPFLGNIYLIAGVLWAAGLLFTPVPYILESEKNLIPNWLVFQVGTKLTMGIFIICLILEYYF